jgi:hypothetical protein
LKVIVFISVLISLLVLQGVTLSQRHMWADEVETVERARSILDGGLPRLVDSENRISVNAAGKEIEDSNLHRYTPWLQFYTGALGLAVGKLVNSTDSDFWVRIPFVFFHSLSSAIIAVEFLPVSAGFKIVSGIFYGMSSVQFVHHRTARYHALLELLFVFGLLALKYKKSWALWMAVPLVNTQTLSGLVASGVLFCLKNSRIDFKNKKMFFDLIPIAVAVIGIAVLCRPWLQSAWGGLGRPQFDVLKDSMVWPGFLFATVLVGLDYYFNRSKQFVMALVAFALGLFVMGAHPFSQGRYYIWISVLSLYLIGSIKIPKIKTEYVALFFILMIEFLPPVERPFQSFRLVYTEFKWDQLGLKQPLRIVLDQIKNVDSQQSQPVLIEYVPQLANWYLKNPIALMPDKRMQNNLSADNKLYSETAEPYFHIWYTNYQQNWACHPQCDFIVEGNDFAVGKSYNLVINSKNKKMKFCIDLALTTNQWNNSPFMNLKTSALIPEGEAKGLMILAHHCPD